MIRDLLVNADQLRPMVDMRIEHDAANDEELKQSFREHGIKDALTCRYTDDPDFFEIVDGRRRYTLGQEVGITEFRITVEEMNDLEAYAVAFMKNHHRKSMAQSEEALWLKHMVDKFELQQKDLAKIVNKSPSWVSQTLKFAEELTTLPPEHRRLIKTERQARSLNQMSDEKKKELLYAGTRVGQLPSGREMERMAASSKDPKEVLTRWKYSDDEFIVYMLTEECGLLPTEAAELLRKFRQKKLSWQERVKTDPGVVRVPDGDPRAKMYAALGEWYPLELIDLIDPYAPAKTLPTWQNNVRGFLRTLLKRTPVNVKQMLLEEFVR